MNPLNYASYEAIKRLVEAEIVLNTECNWVHIKNGGWHLVNEYKPSDSIDLVIPAPCMAEVWRELPGTTYLTSGDIGVSHAYLSTSTKSIQCNPNPTDALIDLLIWIKKEKL